MFKKYLFIAALISLNLTAVSEPLVLHDFRSKESFFGFKTKVNPDFSPGFSFSYYITSHPEIIANKYQTYGPEFGMSLWVGCEEASDTATTDQYCGAAYTMPFTNVDTATDLTPYSTLEILYAADRPFEINLIMLNQGDASYGCTVPATAGNGYETFTCGLTQDSVEAGIPGYLALANWACSNPDDSTNCVPYFQDSILALNLAFISDRFNDTTNVDLMALCFDGHEDCAASTVREGQVLKAYTDTSDYQWGCTDPEAANYSPNALYDLGNCRAVGVGDRLPLGSRFYFDRSSRNLVFRGLTSSGLQKVVVFDIFGREVLKQKIPASGMISLKDFRAGLYIVEFGDSQRKFTLF